MSECLDINKIAKSFRRGTFVKIIIAFYNKKSNIIRPLTFSDLKKLTKLADGSLGHYLTKLMSLGIIEKDELDLYSLRQIVPFCYLFDGLPPCTYIGLLGFKAHHTEPEPITALKLLKEAGVTVEENYVISTKTALKTWHPETVKGLNFVLISEKELFSIPQIEERIKEIVVKESTIRPIILDCTSLTKTATIAMYNVARKYFMPLIYIYEETKELYWIISPEEVKNMLLEKFKFREQLDES